jgi:ubiquinone biosynthesis protein Coq4
MSFYTTEILPLTLEQALEEHYKINPQFTPWHHYKNLESQKMIKSHDIAHLIFGCDTSYSGEFTVQTWVKYGVDMNIKWWTIPKYVFNKDLIQLILPPKLIKYSLSHLKEFGEIDKKIKKLTTSMPQKWVYFQEDTNQTVSDIRAKYNIQII